MEPPYYFLEFLLYNVFVPVFTDMILSFETGSMVHSLRKRHSWPTMQTKRSHSKIIPSIDQDPFPYFVSPLQNEESVLQNHLAAGIAGRRRSRSLPSFHPHTRYSRSVTDKARHRVEKLKKWIERMQIVYWYHDTPKEISADPLPPSDPPKTLDDLLAEERGRDIRSTATSRVRAKTRTPPRKPRAWRQPSDHIWPVAEETEEVGLGIRCEDIKCHL